MGRGDLVRMGRIAATVPHFSNNSASYRGVPELSHIYADVSRQCHNHLRIVRICRSSTSFRFSNTRLTFQGICGLFTKPACPTTLPLATTFVRHPERQALPVAMAAVVRGHACGRGHVPPSVHGHGHCYDRRHGYGMAH